MYIVPRLTACQRVSSSYVILNCSWKTQLDSDWLQFWAKPWEAPASNGRNRTNTVAWRTCKCLSSVVVAPACNWLLGSLDVFVINVAASLTYSFIYSGSNVFQRDLRLVRRWDRNVGVRQHYVQRLWLVGEHPRLPRLHRLPWLPQHHEHVNRESGLLWPLGLSPRPADVRREPGEQLPAGERRERIRRRPQATHVDLAARLRREPSRRHVGPLCGRVAAVELPSAGDRRTDARLDRRPLEPRARSRLRHRVPPRPQNGRTDLRARPARLRHLPALCARALHCQEARTRHPKRVHVPFGRDDDGLRRGQRERGRARRVSIERATSGQEQPEDRRHHFCYLLPRLVSHSLHSVSLPRQGVQRGARGVPVGQHPRAVLVRVQSVRLLVEGSPLSQNLGDDLFQVDGQARGTYGNRPHGFEFVDEREDPAAKINDFCFVGRNAWWWWPWKELKPARFFLTTYAVMIQDELVCSWFIPLKQSCEETNKIHHGRLRRHTNINYCTPTLTFVDSKKQPKVLDWSFCMQSNKPMLHDYCSYEDHNPVHTSDISIKHRINTKTKQDFSCGTCEDKTTRIFLCFAFCSALGFRLLFLCLDYDLMLMTILMSQASLHSFVLPFVLPLCYCVNQAYCLIEAFYAKLNSNAVLEFLYVNSLRPVYTGDFRGDFSHSDSCDWVVESPKYWFI